MAVQADSVVVALIGDTGNLDAAVNGAERNFTRAMSSIERSASSAEKQIVQSSQASAYAARNLGFQIADIGTQLSGGQSPFLIIAQQGPQVSQALQEISASGAGLGQVLRTVALPGFLSILGILGPFVAQLLAGANAAGTKADAMKQLTSAINDMVKSTDAAIASGSREISVNQSAANALLGRAQATRELTKAQIQQQISAVSAARLTEGQGGGSIPGAVIPGRGAASQEATLAALRRQLSEAEAGEARAQLAVRNANAKAIQQRVAERADPRLAAQGRYDRSLDNLNNLRTAGLVGDKQYEQQLTQITEARDRDIKAIGDQAKAERSRISAGKKAAREAEAERKKEIRDLDQLRNQLNSVERQYDPTAAASREFAADLATIGRAMERGIITPARAAELRVKALEARMQAWLGTVQGTEDTLGTGQIFGNTADRIDEETKRRTERSNQARARAEEKYQREQQRKAEENIRDLADIYETLFSGGTASFWDDFKRQGLRALAVIAAQKTLALLTGVSTPLGDTRGLGYFGGAIAGALGGKGDFASGVGRGDVLGLGSIFGGNGLVAGDDTLGKILAGRDPFKKVGGGILGSLFGGLFGRASGGYVAPGQTVRVNEHRGGVELLRMGSQGGSIIPLGRTDAARPQMAAPVISAPQFNMKGAVVTRELFAEMQRISQQSAAQASAAMGKQVLQAVPGRVSQFQNDGT
ncbi:Mg2+ and Co2+ transporter CorA [Sphingomonas trueperi]|uniref:phage tail length tape measure family protein n=1 Tax=Sphingomonas trueperi TaxID=53317 RepID=UPI003394ECA9